MKCLRRQLVWIGLAGLMTAYCWAQQQAALEVTTDFDCTWTLDGKAQGALATGEHRVVSVAAGQHKLHASTADGYGDFETMVEVGPNQQHKVELQLKQWHDNNRNKALGKVARDKAMAELAQHPTWTDPTTGLMWTRASNADKIDWRQAVAYCQSLTLGGYSGWRLPEIDELAALYDPSQPILSWKEQTVWTNFVRGDLLLSGWIWSNTPAKDPREAQYFVFNDGSRYSLRLEHVGLHALCVRTAGTPPGE